MNKNTSAVKYGFLAGIIMIIILMLLYFIDKTKLATFITLIIYVPLIFLMIWGGITIRREAGAFKGFGDAFMTVFIISITATLLFDTYGYVLYKMIDPELPAIIKEKTIQNTTAMMEKFGSPDDKIDEAVKKMQDQDYTPTIKSMATRYASSLVIGAIFSALIALFVNRPDNPAPIKTEG